MNKSALTFQSTNRLQVPSSIPTMPPRLPEENCDVFVASAQGGAEYPALRREWLFESGLLPLTAPMLEGNTSERILYLG